MRSLFKWHLFKR